MIILATNQVLRDAGATKVCLNIPYFLSARSDRKFQPNQSFDLKLTADILNTAGFDRVTILDPHSDVLPALINNCKPITAFDGFISWIPNPTAFWEGKTLVSPDAGAYKKVGKLAEQLNIPLIPGMKIRLQDGFPETQFFGDVKDKDIVIVDDICDGGRTFVELGAKIKALGSKSITLIVTHGIFSKGLTLENIDKIYTTNSYREFDLSGISDKFHVTDIFG
jgi:ribose-phosphate pyrophosphokinase